ncbi:response regulator transcription factor [Polyangium sp. y55x31]|uniref:response regulator transcription factor n=1 Tax=Polyangium sp. y55x31 TaxID=3042688 RepID=UPI002482B668|nr:response regulator transcription factor [Polyangium sp. y55x31]MDI1479157.1 response regulator transcription factor [Polyangium sp. y55x31]
MMPVERTSTSIVFIEDDEKLARLTARYLESHNVRVTLATDARDGIAAVLREHPDVVLLDLMLPEIDGFEVCQRLRARVHTPIIMVTARGEEADRVMGLEGGADDYLPKPFSARELLARIRAHARRARGLSGPPAERQIVAGSLTIDPCARRAIFGETELALTTYEFDLLHALAERAGRVLTREQLVDLVRGSADEAFDRSIDVHVSHLRKKLGDDSKNPRIIKTVRGIGYVFAIDRM